jgi:D-glycero-alpha-D-manno-heptose-7-phosphate kinase
MQNSYKDVTAQGSVRVDLVGGTLDIPPICSLFSPLYTLNLSTSLQAQVSIKWQELDSQSIIIESVDYAKTYHYNLNDLSREHFYPKGIFSKERFQEMTLMMMILEYSNIERGLKIKLWSGSPTGSGLGGSSAMGVTLLKALNVACHLNLSKEAIIQVVSHLERIMLSKGMTGYQDYYPALYHGVLALSTTAQGVVCEQFLDENLFSFLEKSCTLVYSGQSRFSGLNNWEVYKAFFDGDEKTVKGLSAIAALSGSAYQALVEKNYLKLLNLMAQEGALRCELFKGIATQSMHDLSSELKKNFPNYLGFKVCGAGGGGCFLLVGVSKELVTSMIEKHHMTVLQFAVQRDAL